ncbi:hypothetical protein PPSIR1_20129 [Plesiocystis pacifica SIR-1]|uniref:Lipoprotein n=1 Tax=Plesiocystis pacifica SIR-1 TaxID=391625 RepID=A6GGZ1_9BACT|nr:hypothetical protein [Plesiocystis pacifica]EDM74876.1 hypothetical protein PPSIR1_20129 [Plesiocystis pacifica SIR-1]
MTKLRSFTALAVFALVLPALSGCAPSPEDVCGHVVDLMKKQLGGGADAMPEDKLETIKKDCVKEGEKQKKSAALEYKKQAKCILEAEEFTELDECYEKKEDKAAE